MQRELYALRHLALDLFDLLQVDSIFTGQKVARLALAPSLRSRARACRTTFLPAVQIESTSSKSIDLEKKRP